MKKIVIALCALALLGGCAKATLVPPPVTPQPTVVLDPSLSDKEQLLAIGYTVVFDVNSRLEIAETGEECPVCDVEVMLYHGEAPTEYRFFFPDLPGMMMTIEENGWQWTDEELAETYLLPDNTVAGTQVYFAGGGEDIYVSFVPGDNVLVVWHREFTEFDPTITQAEATAPWEIVESRELAVRTPA